MFLTNKIDKTHAKPQKEIRFGRVFPMEKIEFNQRLFK